MALAHHVGRPEARRVVETATRLAMRERRHLKEILAADPIVRAHLTPDQLMALFDPQPHAAVSQPLIDRVLDADREIGGARD